MEPTGRDLVTRAMRAASRNVPDEWGTELELDENGGSFVGRYRGREEDPTYDPPRTIFLLWASDGERLYMRGRFRLVQEFERVAPVIGATVAIYRGPDYVTRNGNSGHAYGIESELCLEPLPAGHAVVDAANLETSLF